MPSPIKAMEMMNQLNLEYGNEPAAKARSMANDKESNPETAKRFENEVEKAKADIKRIADETRAKAEAERPRTYTERLQDMGRLPKGGGGVSGTGGAGEIKALTNPRAMKKGGVVKSASARADGCAIRGKTRA